MVLALKQKIVSNLPANPIMTAIASIPLPPSTPTLIESLKKLAEEQGEDKDVLADLEIQGKTKPSDHGIFREHAILQDGLFILLVMMDRPYVQPIHSYIKSAAPGRRPDQYDGEYLEVIEDCVGATDPLYVRVRKSYFD